MDPAVKRVAAIATVTIIVTLAFIIYVDQKNTEEQVVSEIDSLGYRIDDTSDTAMNVTLQVSVIIENFGKLKDVVIQCSAIDSYLKLKNSTSPLLPPSDTFLSGNSYILDDQYTSSSCDNQASTQVVSENVINQLVVAIPFRFITGSYSFIWYYSVANSYLAGTVHVDVSSASVSTVIEGGQT